MDESCWCYRCDKFVESDAWGVFCSQECQRAYSPRSSFDHPAPPTPPRVAPPSSATTEAIYHHIAYSPRPLVAVATEDEGEEFLLPHSESYSASESARRILLWAQNIPSGPLSDPNKQLPITFKPPPALLRAVAKRPSGTRLDYFSPLSHSTSASSTTATPTTSSPPTPSLRVSSSHHSAVNHEKPTSSPESAASSPLLTPSSSFATPAQLPLLMKSNVTSSSTSPTCSPFNNRLPPSFTSTTPIPNKVQYAPHPPARRRIFTIAQEDSSSSSSSSLSSSPSSFSTPHMSSAYLEPYRPGTACHSRGRQPRRDMLRC